MENIVDARGLSCPQPVLLTKKALQDLDGGRITTLVDSRAALENVVRMAESLDCSVVVEEKHGEYHIHIDKTAEQPEVTLNDYENTVILITGCSLGRGDEKLGAALMRNFLYSLSQKGGAVNTLIFLNSGVELACQDSEVLPHLAGLEQSGVEVLSCGTCLDFYNLRNRLMVGKVTDMYTITGKLSTASKVITL